MHTAREVADGCGGCRGATTSRLRATLVVSIALALTMLSSGQAQAVPPQRSELPLALTVEDHGEACGFPVRWEISGHARQQTFFDRDGNPTRLTVHVREHNIVTNLATGETVEDAPVFLQTVHFREDGTVARVETVGRYVDAGHGREQVQDVGRVVIAPGPEGPELVFSNGRHPLRDVTLVTGDPAGLAIFCDLLS